MGGKRGQTENIRIIEISGKIFCVPTCHVSVSCVMNVIRPSSGDNMLHHGYHHQVTNMGDGIEIRDTKDKLSKMYFLQKSCLATTGPLSWCWHSGSLSV